MVASLSEIEKFFQSNVWTDIKDILESDLHMGLNELVDPALNDLTDINLARGKIEVIQEMLCLKEKLMEALEMEIETEEEEEVLSNAEN